MDLADLRDRFAITNVQAMARVVRERESSQRDDAYTLINGGAHFTAPPWRHPWHGIPTTQGAKACGAYQHLGTTWASLAQRYGIPDFSPASQDAGFVGGLVDRGALDDVVAGRFEEAVTRLRKEWTSLPGAAEARGDWTMAKAKALFLQYGGGLADERAPRPDMPAAPALPDRKETKVDPFALAGLARIIAMVPSLITALGGDKAERNAKAAQIVVDTFTAAVPGATNVQDAVQKAEADPAVRAQAVAAVEGNPLVQHLQEVGGGIGGAREANERLLKDYDDDPFWRIAAKFLFNPTNWVIGWFLYWVQQFIPNLTVMVVTLSKEAIVGLVLMIFAVIAAVSAYVLGVYQQRQKDDQ